MLRAAVADRLHYSYRPSALACPFGLTRTSEADREIVEQIKELLDTRVRPAVAGDGGDIVFPLVISRNPATSAFFTWISCRVNLLCEGSGVKTIYRPGLRLSRESATRENHYCGRYEQKGESHQQRRRWMFASRKIG